MEATTPDQRQDVTSIIKFQIIQQPTLGAQGKILNKYTTICLQPLETRMKASVDPATGCEIIRRAYPPEKYPELAGYYQNNDFETLAHLVWLNPANLSDANYLEIVRTDILSALEPARKQTPKISALNQVTNLLSADEDTKYLQEFETTLSTLINQQNTLEEAGQALIHVYESGLREIELAMVLTVGHQTGCGPEKGCEIIRQAYPPEKYPELAKYYQNNDFKMLAHLVGTMKLRTDILRELDAARNIA